MDVNYKKGFYLPRNPIEQFLDKVSFRNTEVILTLFIFIREMFQKLREKMKI